MDEDSASDTSSASASKPPSPKIRMNEAEAETAEERPRFGGIGSKGLGGEKISTPSFSSGGLGFTAAGAGIGAGKAGIGSSKRGIGSSNHAAPDSSASMNDAVPAGLPTAFGRPQRSFVRSDTGPGSNTPERAATPLSASDAVHFSKLSGSFGARMLSKMGWAAGAGLGTGGQGIVTPVESKLRPKGMGIAFKGFKEKTEQSKAEARRRGEVVSEDEEEGKEKRGKGAKGKGKDRTKREDVWKKPKKTKVKIEHKTYEEVIAEAGGEPTAASVGKIIDATGATVRVSYSVNFVSLTHFVAYSFVKCPR